MTFDPTPYAIGPALLYWLIAAGIFAAVALVVALAISLLTQGFGGLAFVGQQLGDGVRDFTRMSFRRIGALTTLTFKESLRRKTLLVFVIFALLFMFGGWFLANATDRAELQARQHGRVWRTFHSRGRTRRQWGSIRQGRNEKFWRILAFCLERDRVRCLSIVVVPDDEVPLADGNGLRHELEQFHLVTVNARPGADEVN